MGRRDWTVCVAGAVVWGLAGAGAASGGAREALLAGGKEVAASGLPGTVAVYGESAWAMVTAPKGQGVRLPVMAGAAEAGA